MVTHADAQAPGDPEQPDCEEKPVPAEYEYRSQSTNVKHRHKEGRDPNDGLLESPVALENRAYG
jgi:hypothetical protein